jgi:cell wall assembly regulator SMI1
MKEPASPVEALKWGTTLELTTQDGDADPLNLEPGLSPAEIAAFEQRLPCSIPPGVRELLSSCRGFSGGAAERVDFTGVEDLAGYEDVFPHGLPIAADGFGNFWVVDLLPDSRAWAPIYFACHDAPVVLYQSPSLEHFLTELFKCSVAPHTSLVDDVHEDRLFEVWRRNPGVMSHEECRGSVDQELRSFAERLDASFQIVDLREPKIGFGFSWGRYGPQTVVRRHGELPVFAYQKPKSLLSRLFG